MKRGRYIPLPNDQRLVCDIINLARKTPFAPVQVEVDLRELSRLRRRCTPRIAWPVIVMRAYALVSREIPELRQVYSPFPWPRIYQHDESVCLMAIYRQEGDQRCLRFARFCQPENHSLLQLQQQFDDLRKLPLSQLRSLRHQARFAALPFWIRRLGWKVLTHLMPASRARQMGTFGMSLSGVGRVKGTYHLSPATSTVGYDPLCRRGQAHLTLTFDHRILNGKPAQEVLEALVSMLKDRVRNELCMLAKQNPDNSEAAETVSGGAQGQTSVQRAA